MTFRVVTFSVVMSIFETKIVFETLTLPVTSRVEPGVKVPTPVRPAGPNMLVTFATAALREVCAETTGAERAFDA